MPESTKLKILVNTVKKEANKDKAIDLLADMIYQSTTSLSQDIDKLTKALFGNGNPEHSLITRLAQVEKKLNGIMATLGAIGMFTLIYFLTRLFKLI